MRAFVSLLAVSLAVVGCNRSTAAGRPPLPPPSLGAPGAPGTSRADLDRSIQEMDARLASSVDDVAAAIRLAEALLRQVRVASHSAPAVKAELVLRRVLAQHPDEPYEYQVRRLLATALGSQHRFEEAIREAERCLQVRPDDAALHGIVGDARLELGDRDAAFRSFERMVALRPDAASYARVAYARELTGDRDGAIRLMTMALEATSPNDIEALAWHRTQLGALYVSSGQINLASREFDHAAHLFPDYPLALEGQARVAHAQGRHTKALAILDRLTTGTPTSSALALSAQVLRSLGRHAEAARRDVLAEAVRAAERPR